jgi:hypothetical protein
MTDGPDGPTAQYPPRSPRFRVDDPRGPTAQYPPRDPWERDARGFEECGRA